MPLLAENLRSLHASLTVFAIVVAGLVLGREILIPMALATIFAFVLAPLIRKLVKWRVPQSLAATAVYLGAIVTVMIGFLLLSAQLLELTASLSSYRHNIVEKVRQVSGGARDTGILHRAAEAVERLEAEVRREIKKPADSATTTPSTVSQPGSQSPSASPKPEPLTEKDTKSDLFGDAHAWISPLGQAALTLLFTAFLLFQYQDLRDRLVRIVGVDNLSGTTAAMTDAGYRLSRLFLAQAVMNVTFGAYITVALLVIGIPNAPLWGVVACFMRWVPFVGTFIAAAPPVLLAAGVDPGWTTVLATLALFAVSEVIMGHVIEPLVFGKQTGISPFAMILAASFWTLVWGPVGLLLAAPLTLVLVVLGRYVPGLEFFSIMLGDEAALSPEEEFYGRLLTRDSVAAAAQVSDSVDETSLATAGDTIVLPGLALAAHDLRRGRLEPERLAHLKEAMSEVMLVADASTSEAPQKVDPAATRPCAFVVPARGEVDELAATFTARVLETNSSWSIESARNSSGLTALASRGGLSAEKRIDAVVLVSVGGVDRRHLAIMEKRAEKSYPDARIIVLERLELGTMAATPLSTSDNNGAITRRRSLDDVVELLKFGSGNAKAGEASPSAARNMAIPAA